MNINQWLGLSLATVILLLGMSTQGMAVAGQPSLEKLCTKSDAPFGLVETDMSRRIKELIDSLEASDSPLEESEIQVFGPSPLCGGPWSIEVQRVRDKVQRADREREDGRPESAARLRAEARTELRAAWNGLGALETRFLHDLQSLVSYSGRGSQIDGYMEESIEINRTAAWLGDQDLANESLRKAAQEYGESSEKEQERSREGANAEADEGDSGGPPIDGFMKDAIEISRTAALLGDQDLSNECLSKAAQKYGEWSEKEQKRLRDVATAEAEEGYIDPELLLEMLNIARNNKLLGNGESADRTDLDTVGNILLKRFRKMAKNMPCPPDSTTLRDLAQAGRDVELVSQGDQGEIETALQNHVNKYIRGRAQDADQQSRRKLNRTAELMGLDGLAQDLQSGARIAPPKCVTPGWTGTLTFELDKSWHEETTSGMSGPAIGTEKITSDKTTKYSALMVIPLDGPPTAQVTVLELARSVVERRGRIDCGRPGIDYKPVWKRWDVDIDQGFTTKVTAKTTIGHSVIVTDGKVKISFQIPRLGAKTTRLTKYHHSGGCSTPDTKDLIAEYDEEIPARAWVAIQTVDAQHPKLLTGSFSDDQEGMKFSWSLEFQEPPEYPTPPALFGGNVMVGRMQPTVAEVIGLRCQRGYTPSTRPPLYGADSGATTEPWCR